MFHYRYEIHILVIVIIYLWSHTGTIPGPIVYGAALDHSCILWQQDCEGNQGSCSLYSGKSIAWRFFLLAGGFTLLTTTFFVLALLVYKSPDAEEERVMNDDKETKYKSTDEGGRPSLFSVSSRTEIVANESLPAGYDYIPENIISDSTHAQDNSGYDDDGDGDKNFKDVLHISSV